jgi:transposase
MLFGQNSGLPAYYRRTPGNISDVTTLKTTISTLDFLGKTRLQFVLDQGFYSKKNVDTLLDNHYQFVLMLPTNRVWLRDILDKYCKTIASPVHYQKTGEEGEALYMVSHPYMWGGHQCYVHLFYNATRAAEDFDNLTKKLIQCKDELETGCLCESNRVLYERFFVVEKVSTGVLVRYDEEAIVRFRQRYAGFFCLLTNVVLDSCGLLEVYRRKDVVENCFDDLKNGLDMRRLRVHSSGVMDSRLFVQFLALVLLSRVRMVVRQSKDLQYMTVREVMEAMECVVRITYSGRCGSTISETGPLQRKIIDTFNLVLET